MALDPQTQTSVNGHVMDQVDFNQEFIGQNIPFYTGLTGLFCQAIVLFW